MIKKKLQIFNTATITIYVNKYDGKQKNSQEQLEENKNEEKEKSS